MNPMVVRKTILAELAAAEPYQVPTATLHMSCRIRVPDLEFADFTEQLSWLRDNAMVDFIPDRLDPDNRSARKWFMKDAGRAALKL